MNDWEEKKIEIAKAKEYIILEYERIVKLQSKLKKGAADKKFLKHINDVWFEKKLSIIGDKVPSLSTMKRWHLIYCDERDFRSLIPDYGKSRGNTVIPDSHKIVISKVLKKNNLYEPTIFLMREIKRALSKIDLPAQYSDATLRRFIKSCKFEQNCWTKPVLVQPLKGPLKSVLRRLETLEAEVEKRDKGSETIQIPLFMHAVAAGDPCNASSEIEKYITVPKEITRHPESTWAVRANGDSMIGAGIETGDILIADNKAPVKHRCIVIASINGAQTVKRILIQKGAVILSPENSHYESLVLKETDDVKILGTILYIIRQVY